MDHNFGSSSAKLSSPQLPGDGPKSGPQLLHGFELLREETVPDYRGTAYLYRHCKTGAELLVLQNSDTNKWFATSLRTPPDDSTGVPHILEHTVLCGSRNFPLKDPFMELAKSSVKTFLNAMTYGDKTVYPVASQNHADFKNLVTVYLDAVFFPLISELMFRKEGWRFNPLGGSTDQLEYKGVVYSEMKGALSSPERRILQMLEQELFPDSAYRHVSGGEPRNIPDLSYQQFVEFHRRYYHPSNARIILYGDVNLTEIVPVIDRYLGEFDYRDPSSTIPHQKRFTQTPAPVSRDYDPGKQANPGALTGFGWLLTDQADIDRNTALSILSQILIGLDASPLKSALDQSGMIKDLGYSDLDQSVCDQAFYLTVKGVAEEDVLKVQELILATLKNLAATGVSKAIVDAAVAQFEFGTIEAKLDTSIGRTVFDTALKAWNYDLDPIARLKFSESLARIKARLAQGEDVFRPLIEDFLVNNPHRVTATLRPRRGVLAEENAKEQARLAELRSMMTPADLAEVTRTAAALELMAKTPDSAEVKATLPTLELSDLSRKAPLQPIQVGEQNGVMVISHPLETGKIIYANFYFDLQKVADDRLALVPLLGEALTRMSNIGQDYEDLSLEIATKTGSITADTWIQAGTSPESVHAKLKVTAAFLNEQAADAFSIVAKVLSSKDFSDGERFKLLIQERLERLRASAMRNGHAVGRLRASAHFCPSSYIEERMDGLSAIVDLEAYLRLAESNWEALKTSLETTLRSIVSPSNVIIQVTTNADDIEPTVNSMLSLVGKLPDSSNSTTAQRNPTFQKHEAYVIPADSNYVVRSVSLYQGGFRPSGNIAILSSMLNNSYLWQTVREKLGAYGAMAGFDRLTGVFSFASYRDSNVNKTIEAFDAAADFVDSIALSDEELKRQKIGVIGGLDFPKSPLAKAGATFTEFLAGITEDQRQSRRDDVFECTAADLRSMAEMLRYVAREAHTVVLGSQKAIDQANQERGGYLVQINAS